MTLSFTMLFSTLILLGISSRVWSLPFYDIQDNSVHGVRFSGNDQFMVMAFNSFEYYTVQFFSNKQNRCKYPYYSTNLYVYSLAVMPYTKITDSLELFEFVEVSEDMRTQNIQLSVMSFKGSDCGMYRKLSTDAGLAEYEENQVPSKIKIIEYRQLCYITAIFSTFFFLRQFKSISKYERQKKRLKRRINR